MHKVFINKLIVDGIHGLTEKERRLPQRFQVDVEIGTRSRAHLSDSITDTVDYKVARRIAVEMIQEQSFFLLETLVYNIAEQILKNTPAISVSVGVRKLDIWGNAIPGVVMTREKFPDYLGLIDFDLEEVVDSLSADGAVSFPIIPENRRVKLVEEAYSYQYWPQPEIVGGGKVREQLSSVKEFPEDSLFHKFKDDFMELLVRKLSDFKIKDLFSEPIEFNDMSLQKYEIGSVGITPHKDGKSRVNVICVFCLTGEAEFAVCDDRTGTNPKFMSTRPGNIILLRAPGFFRSSFQPFHFVRNITEERIVFGLRQRVG